MSEQRPEIKRLSKEDRIQALAAVHTYFMEYGGVKGKDAGAWNEALNHLALVVNNLVMDIEEEQQKEGE